MKNRSSFVCQQCGFETPQWYGKCPNCDAWSSLVETVKETLRQQDSKTVRLHSQTKPQKLSEVRHIEKNRLKTGFVEFDRVMGGGIVPGSVTLLSGDPGIGKSTILLYVLGHIGGLYIAGEESAEQVKLRAKRMGIEGENIDILNETEVGQVIDAISKGDSETRREEDDKSKKIYSEAGRIVLPSQRLVVVDSIQTLYSSELDGMAGSVGQVRRSAELLVELAKSKHIPIMIIGHVTKEGTIAGPRVLEHMVDTVLYLEGERFATARILRTLKNRFGAVEEVGIFEMGEKGLSEIDNPSEIFLKDRVKNVPGSVVTVVMEGTRPLLIEIQGLVVASQLAMPRRVVSGFDFNRLQLILAVLQKRLNIPLGTFDVFVNVSGGLKVGEPSADLAVALAIISSVKNKPIPEVVAAFGEVGLLGEVRAVGGEERRIKEAKRLGFTSVLSPTTVKNLKKGVDVLGM